MLSATSRLEFGVDEAKFCEREKIKKIDTRRGSRR